MASDRLPDDIDRRLLIPPRGLVAIDQRTDGVDAPVRLVKGHAN